MRIAGCVPSHWRRRQLHGLAGHLARSPDARVRDCVHCRPVARWRHWQAEVGGRAQHARFGRPKRWENELEIYYGQHMAAHQGDIVGWMRNAQQRDEWRAEAKAFSEHVT